MKATLKTILTHGALAITMLSLTFCAPAIPDYGSGIHKLNDGTNMQDVIDDYNEQVCLERGGVVEADGGCSTTYPNDGFTDECLPGSTAESLECNEQRGVEENKGQFFAAFLAVVGKEILGALRYVKNENIGGKWLKAHTEKILKVQSPGGIFTDTDSKLNESILKKHSLLIKPYGGPNSAGRGRMSVQIELEAKNDSIMTFKSKTYGKVAYGKTAMMCLNASFIHNDGQDQYPTDSKLHLQLRSKNNTYEAGATMNKGEFYAKCNEARQEQSYLAFQLSNGLNYHVFPFNPKDMNFSRANNNQDGSHKYEVFVDGDYKELRYYLLNNVLDFTMAGNNVSKIALTGNGYTTQEIQNQTLRNKTPGGSSVESSSTYSDGPTLFQKKYLHLDSSDGVTRTFCNDNSSSNNGSVGCQY